MVKVEIACPVCSKFGIIEVEENIISNSKRGLAAINVSTDLICEHSFIAYIDKNLQVRDVSLSDFIIGIPQIETEHKIDMGGIPDEEQIDIYLIRINVPAEVLTFLLRCGFSNKSVIYLNNIEVVKKHLVNLFEYIFKDTFGFSLLVMNRENFIKSKKKYKNSVVIGTTNKVIQDRDNVIRPKNMKIERIITQKFLDEEYTKSSLIVIKNEIIKAFELSNEIIKFNNNLKENEEFTSKRILDHFQKVMHVKIEREYLDFLINIVINYHDIKLAKSSDVSDFLGY